MWESIGVDNYFTFLIIEFFCKYPPTPDGAAGIAGSEAGEEYVFMKTTEKNVKTKCLHIGILAV